MAVRKDSALEAAVYTGSPCGLMSDTSVSWQLLVRMMKLQAWGTSISTCKRSIGLDRQWSWRSTSEGHSTGQLAARRSSAKTPLDEPSVIEPKRTKLNGTRVRVRVRLNNVNLLTYQPSHHHQPSHVDHIYIFYGYTNKIALNCIKHYEGIKGPGTSRQVGAQCFQTEETIVGTWQETLGPFLRLATPTTPFLLSAVYWYTYFLKALNLADPVTQWWRW